MPTVTITLLLILYPISYCVYLSFFSVNPFTQKKIFIGLANYLHLISDAEFWFSFKNGVVFAGFAVIIQTVLGTFIALLVNQRFWGRAIIRGFTILPYMIPTVIVAIIWKWMLNDLHGIVNQILDALNIISEPIRWFVTPKMSMTTIILVNVWAFYPFVLICVLARLSTIPTDLYEAAQVDGANVIKKFFYITLPELKNTLIVVILLRTIWMFNKFDIVYLITRGGPLGATQHLPILAYNKSFVHFKLGQGSTVSVFILLSLLLFTFVYVFVSKRIGRQFD